MYKLAVFGEQLLLLELLIADCTRVLHCLLLLADLYILAYRQGERVGEALFLLVRGELAASLYLSCFNVGEMLLNKALR